MGQFAKVLPKNMEARKAFVTSGGLKRIQEMQAEPGSKLREYIDQVPDPPAPLCITPAPLPPVSSPTPCVSVLPPPAGAPCVMRDENGVMRDLAIRENSDET